MKLFISRFVALTPVQLAEVLADAAAEIPNAQQLDDQFSGYGLHIHQNPRCVVVWDRKRVWILSATGWMKFYQRPTCVGSIYNRLKFEDRGRLNFHYQGEWDYIIPQKTSDISRRYWALNPVPNQRHF